MSPEAAREFLKKFSEADRAVIGAMLTAAMVEESKFWNERSHCAGEWGRLADDLEGRTL